MPDYLAYRRAISGEQFSDLIESADRDWGAAWNPSEWKILESEIRKMQSELHQKQIAFIVALFPVEPQVSMIHLSAEDVAPQRFFSAMCESAGLRCIDLLPSFRAQPHDQDFFCDHCHLTAAGARVVAERLAVALCPSN